ncbi:MAG TPA: TonB-dependent receptor [Draconibacterium sp.]|nr:TonB-dependent receptor [Draconibacterium sp.]
MRRFVVLVLLMFVHVSWAVAQKQFSLLDTIQLEEIVSYGKLKKYQSGAKIEKIPDSQFKLAQDGNLEQLLSRTLPISFKTDAGGLSTIHIRGTAASHTSVNFGGIDINSLTLGQSNMSVVPLYLFDEVGVQFGSSSSVNGSGNIGGAIHLGLKNNWTTGFKAETRAAHGSFGEQLYGTKLFLGNGKFESVTRAYYYYKTNNFSFTNPNYRDFENQVFEIEDTQHNANVENMGLLQEFNYKFAENNFIVFRGWFEENDRLNQQNMQTNLSQPDFKEKYDDKHVRLWAEYKNKTKQLKYQLSGGYVFDNSVFNSNSADSIQTQSFIGEAFAEHDYSKNGSYKIGAKATRIYPKVYTYSNDLKFEDRIDFYASYYHRFFNKLTASVNLRQGFVTDYKVPFTPAVGLNFLAFSKEKYVLNFNGNIAKSYRVPTFNDRFWIPGGNPDLKPEKGMNYELGTKFSYCDEDISGNIKVNAFYMNINDWILWKNGGSFWYAQNVQNVESKGFEIMTDFTHKLWVLETVSGINYSYTSTQRIESLSSTNALFRQLEYVPMHSFNFFSTSTCKNLDFTIDGNYTGSQFTDEEVRNILDAYFLLNFSAGYRLKLNSTNNFKITGMINNLLDTDYQANWGYAMPGISYRLSLTYNFK